MDLRTRLAAGCDVHFNRDFLLRGIQIPDYGVFGALDQGNAIEHLKEKIRPPIEKNPAKVGLRELDLEGACAARDRTAKEIIPDKIFVPCLDAQTGNAGSA